MKPTREHVTWRQSLRGYLWAAPWFVGFAALTVGPLLFAAVISLTDWNGISDLGPLFGVRPDGAPAAAAEGPDQLARWPHWVGLANYRDAFVPAPDIPFSQALWLDEFYRSLVNTAIYAVGSVLLTLGAALGLAMLLNQKLRGISVFRTIFFMPAIVSGVATMVMWRWIYNAEFGLLNTGLRRLYAAWNWAAPASWHLDLGAVPGWIESPHWALASLVFMAAWGAGSAMMIFLAGLQNIPEHLYEAAAIDGAGRWRKFVHITLPQLSPTIFFNLVIGIIASFQVFAEAYLLPSEPGGPANATLVYVLYIYQKAFHENEMGYACALGWILFGIILAATLLLVGASRRWVYYEGEAA